MRRLSLQWRMTLMTSLLIGATCVCMELLLCGSGVRYMSRIGIKSLICLPEAIRSCWAR